MPTHVVTYMCAVCAHACAPGWCVTCKCLLPPLTLPGSVLTIWALRPPDSGTGVSRHPLPTPSQFWPPLVRGSSPPGHPGLAWTVPALPSSFPSLTPSRWGSLGQGSVQAQGVGRESTRTLTSVVMQGLRCPSPVISPALRPMAMWCVAVFLAAGCWGHRQWVQGKLERR